VSLFRRRTPAEPSSVPTPHEPDPRAVRELMRAVEDDLTGRLDFEFRETGAQAHVFVYRGAVYAVDLQGFAPRVGSRLVSAGRITPEAAAELPPGADAGREAVRRGWIDADQLSDVHREFTVAGMGAVVQCREPRITRVPDAVTDAFCTVPLPVAPLLDSLTVRDERLLRTWAGLAPGADPAMTSFTSTSVLLPDSLDHPEVQALHRELRPGTSVDEAAERSGFTRAEAVHLLGLVAAAGCARLEPRPISSPPADRLRTPEEFGRRRLAVPGPSS